MNKGAQFLHNHPMTEQRLGLDDKHVIVDRDAWEHARAKLNNLPLSPAEGAEEILEPLIIPNDMIGEMLGCGTMFVGYNDAIWAMKKFAAQQHEMPESTDSSPFAILQALVNEFMPKRYCGPEARRYAKIIASKYAQKIADKMVSERDENAEQYSDALLNFIDEVQYMQKLYTASRFTQAEKKRDELAEMLDDIMRKP